jgi:transglutaminase-like putative cysteine protease
MRIKLSSVIFICGLCTLGLLSGCGGKNELEKAQQAVRQSSALYNRAINSYKDIISRGKDDQQLSRMHFELGQLYYTHGDLRPAVDELKKTSQPEAIKLLAISYYQLGDFTDGLEVFDKIKAPDDQTRYYHGLTCERLNLYDQSLDIYQKIKSPQFAALAAERINLIEKQISPALIKDIDPKAAGIIKDAPGQEDYPQAGGLILSCDERVEITDQDTQVSSLHYMIKILNERGKEDFAEAQIEYDTTYEKIELEYARTIKPDGTVADVGSRHIRDVSKYLNFPLYSNVHVYIISFPEITEGAVVEYKLKIYRNKLIDKNDFALDYPLQTSEPVISADFLLSLPKANSINIKTINEKYNNFGASLQPDVQKTAGRVIYRWQFKAIPQIIPESNMPATVQINPAVLISTFKSWKAIYQWWWGLAQDKIKADAAIKNKAAELIQGLTSQEEKIRAIYNFCAQKIRYVAVEYGQAGFEPHKAEDIFRNKYGDCKDKAMLLVTMLKEAGVEAYPVLIPTRDYYNLNPDFPSMMFNHCIAAVVLQDKTVFLDPTAETCPFGDLPSDDQDRQVLVFKDDGYKIEVTPLYPAGHNLVKQDTVIKINADESIVAGKSVFTYGRYGQAQRYWLLYTPPQLVEEALKEKIQEISIGSQLESYSVENLNDLNKPVVLNYKFKGGEYLTSAGNLRIIPQLTGLDSGLVAKDKRRFPIDFNIPDSKETDFSIEIPPGFSVKYMPENVDEDSPWLKFNVQYRQEGNKIYFLQKAQLNDTKVSEADYPEFKKFFEALAKKIKQRIVLERKK